MKHQFITVTFFPFHHCISFCGAYFCNCSYIGSCNDVLEIEIKPNNTVKLQRGPKSYCYGPFVKALELCRDNIMVVGHEKKNHSEKDIGRDDREKTIQVDVDEGDHKVDDGGLDAFLDSCDNEFDDEGDDDDDDGEIDDFGDCFYNTSTNSNGTQVNNSSSMIAADLRALDVLKDVLQNVKAGLVKNPLATQSQSNIIKHDGEDGNNMKEPSDNNIMDTFCAMLVRSEIQTADFYLAVASVLRRRLVVHLEEQSSSKERLSHGLATEEDYQFDDEELVHEQANAIATAFLTIRYPQIGTKNISSNMKG